MKRQCLYTLLIVTTVSHALAEKSDYTSAVEVTKKHPTEDRLLTNIARVRNSTKILHSKSEDSESNDKTVDKKPRTSIHGSPDTEFRDNSSCCGPRYNSGSLARPESHYNRSPADSNRHPPQYGERLPVDRYGWQGQGRPPGSNGRPGSGNYLGAYIGNAHYEGSQTGDRFSPRPAHGSESSSRPGGAHGSGTSGGYNYANGGYGSYGVGRPFGHGGSINGGGFGISGTLADGDEFGPAEPNYPEGNVPPHPNIHTQKAVALKALAGVALIGAAAALATNPVLLPLGIISGRRKRSEFSVMDEDIQADYILKILKNNLVKVYGNGAGNKLVVSPRCVARLTCEIQKSYLSDLRNDVELLKETRNSKDRLTHLIRSNVLNLDSVDANLKKLIKAASSVASNGGNCNLFACMFIKAG